MDRPDELHRRIAELEDRLSRLSGASLRINESLDFGTVLQEVVDSARTMTASRYGAITVFGEAGQTPDFIVSGLSVEEHQGLWDMPGGRGFFEYLSGLEQPLRVSNFDSHLRALNMPGFLPSVPVVSLLVAPVRHHGVGVGTIYLSRGADGPEFTRNDEETLVLFASQAAMAIANARRHREERRARADLETLIDTSPVGVAVFDAVTGAPVSFNREARRKRMYTKFGVLQGMNSTNFLQAITLLATQKRQRRATGSPIAPAIGCKRSDILSLTLDEYRMWADRVERGYEEAARFLNSHFVFTQVNVPYNTQLVPLSALYVELGRDLDPADARTRLDRWYWCGVFGEMYGSAVESQYARDLTEVPEYIRNGSKPTLIREANIAPARLISLRTRQRRSSSDRRSPPVKVAPYRALTHPLDRHCHSINTWVTVGSFTRAE